MYLLDTNVLSELRRAKKANPIVYAWAAAIPVSEFFISVITILELEWGVLAMERRDSAQGIILREWLSGQVLPLFERRVLPVDQAVALRCAQLHVPDPRSERDALIAATALVHGMRVVTRNTVDFIPMGVHVLNPWDEKPAS